MLWMNSRLLDVYCGSRKKIWYIGNNMHSSYFRDQLYHFFVSHLLSACEGGRPLLHSSHSLHILHQFNTIQMSTELFLAFAHQRSFSLPHREASSAYTNCSVWYEVQKCPSPNPLQLTQKRASWLHFTEQQSFSPSLLSSLFLYC